MRSRLRCRGSACRPPGPVLAAGPAPPLGGSSSSERSGAAGASACRACQAAANKASWSAESLLALAVPLGVQQLAQQGLDFVALGELAIQLRHQVQHHLLQDSGILRKVFGIDGHESNSVLA